MDETILVVDDEKSIRFTLSMFLTEAGYRVRTAENYETAAAAIETTCFDLVVADIILGGRTGIDLLREIKRRGLPTLTVIITGKPDIETAAQSVRLGAFDYITKPVRKDTLLRVAAAAMQHRALQQARLRAEAEREHARRSLEATLNSIPDAILTIDRTMTVLEANQALERICGVPAAQVVGRPFEEAFDRCSRACGASIRETLFSRNTVKQFNLRCDRRDRPLQTVSLTSSPLRTQDGAFTGAAVVVADMTRIADLALEGSARRGFDALVGQSPAMQDLYRLLEYLADTDTTVLITGETGTGKELVARALHRSGSRAAKPFVAVNCSALSEPLLESELFGHVKGAFTGAQRDMRGRFELAHGGTILLDEIGDISPRIQLKLLRVLQEKEFERVGDPAPVKVDVRVIASTNRDLREQVGAGAFREDLYYRLKVVEVKLPALRERRDDIPLLIEHFFNQFARKTKKPVRGVSDEARDLLMRYAWPGNVRELEHAVEHAFILCPGPEILPEHLPAEICGAAPEPSAARGEASAADPQRVRAALQKTGWNKAKAARLLGVSRPTLYNLIKKYSISPE